MPPPRFDVAGEGCEDQAKAFEENRASLNPDSDRSPTVTLNNESGSNNDDVSSEVAESDSGRPVVEDDRVTMR